MCVYRGIFKRFMFYLTGHTFIFPITKFEGQRDQVELMTSPENRPFQTGNDRIPTHPFSDANLLFVSGGCIF